MKHTTGILLVAVLAVAQFAMAQSEEPQRNSQGYGYGAVGTLRGPGGFSGASQIGGGAEGTFYKGLGAGIDVGYLFPTSAFSAGFGTLSPGVLYQFSPKRRTVPFVTGGYTLGFRHGAWNMIHFGGGATYWFSERVGLRVEVRDHMPTQSTIGNAVAGVIPGRWEKVDSLDNGEDIIVVMKSGERFNANFRSSDLDSITVKPMEEKERRIPKSEVKQVEREGVKQDRALDGAAIGAGAGAALGALLGSRSEDDREVTIVGGLIAFAAIGFGVGYAVDSSTGKPILLFEAPE